jgi:hypothetical protein
VTVSLRDRIRQRAEERGAEKSDPFILIVGPSEKTVDGAEGPVGSADVAEASQGLFSFLFFFIAELDLFPRLLPPLRTW